MMRPQAQHEQGDENIQDISPPSGIERRFDHYLQSALLGLDIVVATDFDHEGVGARGQTGERDIGIVELGGYPVVAQSLKAIGELHVGVGKSLVGSHLNGELALAVLQYKATRLLERLLQYDATIILGADAYLLVEQHQTGKDRTTALDIATQHVGRDDIHATGSAEENVAIVSETHRTLVVRTWQQTILLGVVDHIESPLSVLLVNYHMSKSKLGGYPHVIPAVLNNTADIRTFKTVLLVELQHIAALGVIYRKSRRRGIPYKTATVHNHLGGSGSRNEATQRVGRDGHIDHLIYLRVDDGIEIRRSNHYPSVVGHLHRRYVVARHILVLGVVCGELSCLRRVFLHTRSERAYPHISVAVFCQSPNILVDNTVGRGHIGGDSTINDMRQTAIVCTCPYRTVGCTEQAYHDVRH